MSQEKAKYRILRLSFIGNQLLDEGAEVEYDGEPGTALEPLNDAAKAAKSKAKHKGDFVAEFPGKEPLNDGGDDDELTKLKEEYELLFNEKPHHNAKAETIREKIADKRAELGV